MSGKTDPIFDDKSKLWKIEDFGGLELLKAKSSRRIHPKHWHNTYNIDVVVMGKHELEHESSSYSAGPGCIFLFNPEEVHSSHLGRSPSVVYRTLYPTQHLMEGLSQELNVRTGKLPFFSSPVVYDPALARMFNTAHALYEQGRSFLRAHSILLLAFSEAICKYSDEARELPKVGREETAVFRAKQFIHENYLREITLNEIAGVSGLSTFHFLRCFRQATGIPPFAFVMNLRIEKAKELLRNGWKIVDVAAATGFYDQSHLTNYFKSIVSVTPRHYRTAHLGKKRMGPSGQ